MKAKENKIIELQNDLEGINSKDLIMAFFYANWSEPCDRVSSMINEINKEYNNRLKVVKIEIDTYVDIASKYKISIIPTIMFFKNGQKLHEIITIPTKENLLTSIKNLCS